jgi:hypothetical protein
MGKARRMAVEMLSMNKIWKVVALISLAAIPLILLAKKQTGDSGLVPESGDDSDIFERELSVD